LDEIRGRPDDEVIVEAQPRPELIETVADVARCAGGDGAVRPDWTADTFRWRFFHPHGPRHLLLRHADEPRSFLILGAGNHRGLVAGRIVDLFCSDFDQFRALMRKAQRVLRNLGAHVMLVCSADRWIDEMIRRYGLRPLTADHPAFFFHASSRQRFENFALRGSAGDFGFEAILS
jgi:hypothetical protein